MDIEDIESNPGLSLKTTLLLDAITKIRLFKYTENFTTKK